MNCLPGKSEKSFHRKKSTSVLKIARLWVWDATLFSYWLPLLEQDCIIQWSSPRKEVTGPQIFLRLLRRSKYKASGNLRVSPLCHFRLYDSEAPTERVDTWAKGRGGSSKTKSWVVYLITASYQFPFSFSQHHGYQRLQVRATGNTGACHEEHGKLWTSEGH